MLFFGLLLQRLGVARATDPPIPLPSRSFRAIKIREMDPQWNWHMVRLVRCARKK